MRSRTAGGQEAKRRREPIPSSVCVSRALGTDTASGDSQGSYGSGAITAMRAPLPGAHVRSCSTHITQHLHMIPAMGTSASSGGGFSKQSTLTASVSWSVTDNLRLSPDTANWWRLWM